MSQIHYEIITLKDLMAMSKYIFIAKRIDSTEKKIEFNDIPPFVTNIDHYEIIKELAGKAESRVIEVLPANHKINLKMHTEYYREGKSRSPAYFLYDSPVESDTCIIFLVDAYRYAVDGAVEDVSRKKEVVKLIKRKGRPSH